MGREDHCLTRDTVHSVVCRPGGRETRGKNLTREIERTITRRMEMLESGMARFVSYQGGVTGGFVEYMPAEASESGSRHVLLLGPGEGGPRAGAPRRTSCPGPGAARRSRHRLPRQRPSLLPPSLGLDVGPPEREGRRVLGDDV